MTSYLTTEEVDALQSSSLPTDTPYAIRNVSYTQFSIARHYGGISYNGERYDYIPETDELIRVDVRKWIEARRKQFKRAAVERENAKQGQLFGRSE